MATTKHSNPSIEVPWKQTFKLKHDLTEVECWNFTSGDKFTLPAGTLVRLENVNDSTSITVCVVDEKGNAPGIELTYVPTYHAHIKSTHDRTPVVQRGYRFICENQKLSAAIGIPLPEKQYDLVGEIMAYESGQASPTRTKKLFSTLRKTGIGKKLQGHYSSRM